MSTSIDIADAVVADLNAATFSQAFTATRLYRPLFDLEDLKTLTVSVVPKALAINSASRQQDFFDLEIDVAVQKKVDPGAVSELDDLMDLVEEIADQLRDGKLTNQPNAGLTGIENEPVFAPEHLNTKRVFTSVLTVSYRVWR